MNIKETCFFAAVLGSYIVASENSESLQMKNTISDAKCILAGYKEFMDEI